MPGKIDGVSVPFVPIGGLEGLPQRKPLTTPEAGADFRKLLIEKLQQENNIRFSAHAQTRLESRGIELTADRVARLAEALDRAREKGAHDSLVLMDDAAFIVNVDNRTVITAMDEASLRENVFTNIDSAVIIK
jgi:flagellar operon protein